MERVHPSSLLLLMLPPAAATHQLRCFCLSELGAISPVHHAANRLFPLQNLSCFAFQAAIKFAGSDFFSTEIPQGQRLFDFIHGSG